MRALVTGYAGLLGRHVARALKRDGFIVRVVLNRHTVPRSAFPHEADELMWGSIEDRSLVRHTVEGVQAVMHCAWRFSRQTADRPTVNERATELLLEESIEAGVGWFAFISSVAVYGMSRSIKSPITEATALASGKDLAFIYASEKISVEQMLQSCATNNMRLGVFRPGPIFDDQKSPVKTLIDFGGKLWGIGIGTGRNHLPYIHAADVADALSRWLKINGDHAVLNITPSISLRHDEWYRRWGVLHGLDIRPLFVRGTFVRLAALGTSTLKRLLGRPEDKDVQYAIACATRDLQYSNQKARNLLSWTPRETDRYTV
jgi:nucleoside-diphosphate-sugar epimerase